MFCSLRNTKPASSISQCFPFSFLGVVVFSFFSSSFFARFTRTLTHRGNRLPAHGLFSPLAPYVKSSLRRSGSMRARMTIRAFSRTYSRVVRAIAFDVRARKEVALILLQWVSAENRICRSFREHRNTFNFVLVKIFLMEERVFRFRGSFHIRY